MSNFDLNVESYSTEELYKVIKTNKNCDDYEISININKIISNIKDSEHEYKYVVFLKDIGSNRSVYSEYGWKNTGTLFKSHLISYAIEFLREEIDQEVDDDGNVIKKTLGIERIPDPMLLKEMQQYYPGLNMDRLVAFSALVAFVKVQQANRGYAKRRESEKPLQKSENLYKLKSSPFRNLGRNKSTRTKKPRSGFKNLR